MGYALKLEITILKVPDEGLDTDIVGEEQHTIHIPIINLDRAKELARYFISSLTNALKERKGEQKDV